MLIGAEVAAVGKAESEPTLGELAPRWGDPQRRSQFQGTRMASTKALGSEVARDVLEIKEGLMTSNYLSVVVCAFFKIFFSC